MKVKELIAKLQEADLEEEVCFQFLDGCCGDTKSLILNDLEIVTLKEELGFPVFTFKHIPGYYSCMQTGATIRKHEEYWKSFGKEDPYWKEKK